MTRSSPNTSTRARLIIDTGTSYSPDLSGPASPWSVCSSVPSCSLDSDEEGSVMNNMMLDSPVVDEVMLDIPVVVYEEASRPADEQPSPITAQKTHQTLHAITALQPTIPEFPLEIFFYGPLMDPHVLSYFARLGSTPELLDASTTGLRLVRWGTHPVAVPEPGGDGVVHGKVWTCETAERFGLLQRYHTSMYAPRACRVEMHDGPAVGMCIDAWTFCWPTAARGTERLEDMEGGERWDVDGYRRSSVYKMIREANVWVDTADVEGGLPETRARWPVMLAT